MAITVGDMTKDELKELIETLIEQKLLELLGDPEEGLPIRKAVRDRLLRQKKAVAAGEDTMRTHYNLAMLYKKKGRLDEAISELEGALGMAPQEVRVYIQLGLIYASLDELEKARSVFKKALEIDPRNSQALDSLKKLAL